MPEVATPKTLKEGPGSRIGRECEVVVDISVQPTGLITKEMTKSKFSAKG